MPTAANTNTLTRQRPFRWVPYGALPQAMKGRPPPEEGDFSLRVLLPVDAAGNTRPGAAAFTFSAIEAPTVVAMTCVACWSEAESVEAWLVALSTWEVERSKVPGYLLLEPLPDESGPVPWCTQCLLPVAFEMDLERREAMEALVKAVAQEIVDLETSGVD